MIPGQLHSQHVPGPVGLAADAAWVGEAVNVCLHMLLELALVISELAAHSAGPHPVVIAWDVLNLLILVLPSPAGTISLPAVYSISVTSSFSVTICGKCPLSDVLSSAMFPRPPAYLVSPLTLSLRAQTLGPQPHPGRGSPASASGGSYTPLR